MTRCACVIGESRTDFSCAKNGLFKAFESELDTIEYGIRFGKAYWTELHTKHPLSS